MVIVIIGPTGVGKTKLSIELAKRLNGEIINADSTQIYKGLDIATAKIGEDEKEGIIHHLIDIKDISEDYTVYDFQRDCRHKIDEIKNKNKIPIIVGGTGLYIKAVLYDYKFEEESKKEYSFDDVNIYEQLLMIDPNTDIHPNNKKRIIRALEYYYNNGKILHKKNDELIYDSLFICLDLDRDTLYERINNRVDEMIKNGLIDEAKRIFDSNIRTKAVLTPIGYKELFPYFEGNKELDECISLIKQKSRKYAKRQNTWNKHQFNINLFTVNPDNFDETINDVINFINK